MRIAITPHDILSDEPERIISLLNEGWTYVHLRHPDASIRDIQNIIEAIPQKLHSKLRLHGHFELIHSFNIGGLHLNHRCPIPPPGFTEKLSRSCHTPAELCNQRNMEYVTFSPVFPSISKHGYTPAYTLEQIAAAISRASVPVVALGGVTPDKATLLQQIGFSGYACLGSIWPHNEYK